MRRRRKASDIVQMPWRQRRNPFVPWRIISDDEVAALYHAALELLETMGARCPVPEAQEILTKAGAQVDRDTNVIRIGRDIVESVRVSAPESFVLTPRNPAHAVQIGGAHFGTATVVGPPHVSDLTRGRRTSTLADMEELLKLTQYFNCMQMNGWVCEPMDCEVKVRHLDAAFAMLTLTDKVPYLACQSRQRIRDVLELCALARGESLEDFARRPGSLSIINTNTPLTFDVPMTIGIMDMARYGQPTLLTPFVMAGASTPATIAAAMVLNTAEVLFGVVLAQLIRPGAPVVYGSAAMNVDMKTGAPAYGLADMQRCSLIAGQMARHLKLPMRSSNFSASNIPDFASGYESANSSMIHLASGAHVLMHAGGWVEGGLCTSYEKFVLDCEIMQSLLRMTEPVDTSASEMALDEMRSVGHGGHFFGTERTIASFESAFYRPLVSSTQNYGAWIEAGGKSAAERATAIWQEALNQYEAPELNESNREAMADFVARRKVEGGAGIE